MIQIFLEEYGTLFTAHVYSISHISRGLSKLKSVVCHHFNVNRFAGLLRYVHSHNFQMYFAEATNWLRIVFYHSISTVLCGNL